MYETTEYYSDYESLERKVRVDHLAALIEECDRRLADMQPEIERLMEIRHKLYYLPQTQLSPELSVREQLYDEPTYNDVMVYGENPNVDVMDNDAPRGGDLGARKGANFHEGERYDEGEYAEAILAAGDSLGFVRKEVAHTTDPLDRELGIADSDLDPIGQVEAVIVPGAAGMSNAIRIRDALRNIEQGRVETNKLIIATCDREVGEAEQARIQKRFQGGSTEFESAIVALNELAGTSIKPAETEPLPVTLPGGAFEGKISHQTVTINGKELDCIVVSAPYDSRRVYRRKKDGTPEYAVRANTDETFIAVNSLLSDAPLQDILIESHDTWIKGQGVIAEQTFGLAGKNVIATGPRKLDRIKQVTGTDGAVRLALSQPEDVVDEIGKTYAYLTQTRIKAAKQLSELTA